MTFSNHPIVVAVVLFLSVYSVLKFGFFFFLPYAKRRAALDRSYAGRAHAGATADIVLLLIGIAVGAALLATGAEPIAFLGGMFVGATLIQLFFHAFHVDPPADRQAPEPRSPLKRLSYAIQDRPGRAAREMIAYAGIVGSAMILFAFR